ncbi:MAG TPA: HAD family hydrolase [Anaerolineae bacterium]|nr:HAD family hydrolase [Caldilineae bacterium]HID35173.1 HAD family hydrolase [Anaerolineae bacterium]
MTLFDAIIFDVDGVLWAAQDAYNACTLFVARTLAQEQDWPTAGLDLEHVRAFKRSGGFNSDWDMIWALAVLLQARAQGRIPPERSWFDLVEENAGRGVTWAQNYAGPDAPDFRQLQTLYDAYYWGADLYPRIYDREPVVVHRPGFAHAERAYARPDLFPRLRQAGVQRAGIITGRNRNEMRTPMAALHFDGLLVPDAIFTDEDGHKPDPDLLVRAIDRLNARRAVMVGDSPDDLRLVLNYRQLPARGRRAQVLTVIIDHDDDPQYWRDLGADAVLTDVNDLPDWLLRK